MQRGGGTWAQRMREEMMMQEERRKNQEALNKEKNDLALKHDKEKRDALQSMQKMKMERL